MLAETPLSSALLMAYARVTETNKTAIHGSSQRALLRLMRANPTDRVMARPLQVGRWPIWELGLVPVYRQTARVSKDRQVADGSRALRPGGRAWPPNRRLD